MTTRRRWAYVALAVATLLLVGHAYQRVMEGRDRRASPPPGELVDVGAGARHIHCEGRGSPTIVLDAGIGSFSTDWVRVRPDLASTTRTCTYDRGGYGWSDPGPEPRDVERLSDELHTLLDAAGEEGPYVLVGHSLGGAVAWRFAEEHPDDVAGVVLVDAPDRAELERSAEGSVDRLRSQRMFHGTLHGLATTGVLRPLAAILGDSIAPDTIRYLDESDRSTYVSMMVRRAGFRTARRELDATRASAAQLGGAGALGDTPLMIVTATEAGIDDWADRQERLTSLSTRSEQTFAESSHYVHTERPEVVVEAVGRVLDR